MPANTQGGGDSSKPEPRAQVKAPQVKADQDAIAKEMEAVLTESLVNSASSSTLDRAQFYAGQERLTLQGQSVQRVRELQEENDHLQREIAAKEAELHSCGDPLTILADIEHRKIMIARNTGEILKIYLKNEERMKRIQELEDHNAKIQNQMMEMQGRFIATKNMEEKTKFASEFFVLKSERERNLQEISNLDQK